MVSGLKHVLAASTLPLYQLVTAQNPGTQTPEVHPSLPTWKCTTSGGCVQQSTSVVLDWNYRYIHTINGSTSCTTSSGGPNTSLCPNAQTCAQNCVVEGANYTAAGVSTSGNALTMYQYIQSNGKTTNASPRLYLLGSDGNYVMMKLLGQELTFTVDLSTLPCGENGALYFSEMDASGGRNPYNTGGANYGGGYCDAQCPVESWKNGTVNPSSAKYCCNEMDILEANSQANAFTPHPCSSSSCDGSGCGWNPYNQGATGYYGPGKTVDTSKPVTIVTQFITDSGSTSGTLTQINRKWIQNGAVIASSKSTGDTITSSWCTSADGGISSYGGLATMGQALGRGMVLAFSIWNDNGQYMNWLDSGSNGPCSSTAGNPSTIMSQNPGTHVIFSNIRWGDIGSTYTASGSTGTTGSTGSSTPSSTAPTGATQSHYGQCGGEGYTGVTTCASPYTCTESNQYYSQCL